MSDKTVLQNIINGESVPSADGATMDIIDPSTGAVYATSPCPARRTSTRLRRRNRGVQSLALVDPGERQLALLKFADHIEETPTSWSRSRSRTPEADRVDESEESARWSTDPVLRRCGQRARGTLAGRVHARPYVVDPPGAGRRRRPGRAMELPDDDVDLENRARPWRPAARLSSSRRTPRRPARCGWAGRCRSSIPRGVVNVICGDRDSTRPNIDRLFSEKPNSDMIDSVPISDTGIASNGMIAVRQRCRNSITTITARIIASTSVSCTASTAARVNATGLKMMSYLTPAGTAP